MEDGLPTDFELPEIAGNLDGIDAALLEGEPSPGRRLSPAAGKHTYLPPKSRYECLGTMEAILH